MKKKTKLVLPALCLLAAIAAYFMFRIPLTVVRYEVKTKLTESIRIVQLTDLHGWTFGDDNEELVSLVKEQRPDMILMTGDMLDRDDADAGIVCRLIGALQDTAPVYYGYGNHEMGWMERTGTDLRPILTEAGATVLDVEYLDLELKRQPIRLGGYYNYYRQPHMLNSVPEGIRAERAFADDFENTGRYKIFMHHIATSWLDWNAKDKYPVDLVLTGHYHGGQARIPFVGGLVAPYVGWFPPYTEGIYVGEKATVILSAGLGSRPNIPRINNPPQLVVVDLVPET